MSGPIDLRPDILPQSTRLADVVNQLDAIGFSIGNTYLSIWTALVVLFVAVVIFLLARLATRLAHRMLGRITRMDNTQKLLADKFVSIMVWVIAILIGIDLLGVDLTALTVFSGAFGLAIGFGLQKTFGNLIAGIILLMDRSIKPGDVIAVSDMSGRESFGQIRKIGIRAISVITRDRKEYLIPNENLMINQVENWSYSSLDMRVKAPIGVSYGTDIELAERLMLEAVRDVPRVLDNPEARVLLMGFGNSSIDFEIRFWIKDPEEGISNVRSDVLKCVWRKFREHEVEIPFPQRDLNLRDNAQFRDLVAALGQRGSTSQKTDD